ncbi:MAG: phosphomannomutase/phosphoglucomutase, partial [Porticoccaceae bacterium]
VDSESVTVDETVIEDEPISEDEPAAENEIIAVDESPTNESALTEEEPQSEEEPQPEKEPEPEQESQPKIVALSELPNNIGDPNFKVPDRVFRDYDIRGIAGAEITPEFASRLGKTIGTIILNNGHSAIYVGRDGRLTSNQLSQALQQGLLSTGCHVIDLGEITTPVLNFAVHHSGQSSCGIMVTASHNPAHYNGFKVIIKGQVIAGPILQLLKPMLDKAEFTCSDEGQRFSRDIVTQYIRHIVEESTVDKSFKVVIDAGNAVAGPVAVKLFESLGHTVIPLYCEVDGAFPNHEPNPADEQNLQTLITKVREVNADLGFAFDGDGDRIVVISGSGEIIWPDMLMMMFAPDVLLNNPDTDIVFDVKSSKRLAEVIREHNGRPMMCKTGHAHVRKAVQHNNAPLGGEFSGHIFFNDRWKGFDDGIYAAVRLLEILSNQERHRTLDSIITEFKGSSYTPEILIAVDEDEKFELISKLVAGCQFKGAKIITLDGLRVEYPDGWGLIRASNTTANLTLRFEADDDKSLEDIKQRFRVALAPFINQIEEYI